MRKGEGEHIRFFSLFFLIYDILEHDKEGFLLVNRSLPIPLPHVTSDKACVHLPPSHNANANVSGDAHPQKEYIF